MTQNATPATEARPDPDLPDTDDPIVLRELLRQAREHLRLRESIEQLMADNVARTEALLVEARAAQRQAASVDRQTLADAVTAVRASLHDALASLEQLDAMLKTPAPPEESPAAPLDRDEPAAIEHNVPTPPDPASDGPHTIEVLMHEVHTPALARSAQQYLLGIDGVTGAEVRELAEGLLRITVVSAVPITASSLAGWEPARRRTVRTSSADVLELELDASAG